MDVTDWEKSLSNINDSSSSLHCPQIHMNFIEIQYYIAIMNILQERGILECLDNFFIVRYFPDSELWLQSHLDLDELKCDYSYSMHSNKPTYRIVIYYCMDPVLAKIAGKMQ